MAKRGKVKSKHDQQTLKRPTRYRKYLQFFLIVCEDEKTEPKYFESFVDLFPDETMYLETVGTGRSPLGVVKSSISEREKLYQKSRRHIDFVWAIFDKDDADINETTVKNFKEAFELANQEDIKIAYSNEVFELWLLLHFIEVDVSVPMGRKVIYQRLDEVLKLKQNDFVYKHGNTDVIDLVQKYGNEEKACKRAEFLFKHHKNIEPIQANPSTKVHLLVKELREWIEYYNWKK